MPLCWAASNETAVPARDAAQPRGVTFAAFRIVMKILLIYPYFLENRVHAEELQAVPIGLYYLAAVLREQGYETHILNWHDRRTTPETIAAALRALQADVIGFSVLNANRWGAIEIARIAKQLDPDVQIVFGGVGATFLWEHFLTHFPVVDYVVLGEGERSFPALLQALADGDPRAPAAVHGIALRQGGRCVRTPAADPVDDLDSLPPPARYYDFQHLAMTRGCPGSCTFCGSPRFWGTAVRSHSPAYFVGQIELLYRRGGRFFYVSDDTFTLNKRRVITTCKLMVEKKFDIAWAAISRVNCVDAEILSWMRKAGCVQLSYGVESGAQTMRRFFNKPLSTQQIERAFALTTRHGILARAYFIYGSPGENRSTIQATIDLMLRIKPLSTIFYILDIFPGTALYSDYLQRCAASDDVWLQRIEDLLYFETDPQLNAEEVLAFGERLREAFFTHLPHFVAAIDLLPDPAFAARHADFLSRLAMTFSHGDYAGHPQLPDSERIAEELYARALNYHPDHRAFLGLAVIQQKKGAFEASVATLQRGLQAYPASEALNICMAVSRMNLKAFDEALAHLLPFENSPQALPHIVACYQAKGDRRAAEVFARRQSGR